MDFIIAGSLLFAFFPLSLQSGKTRRRETSFRLIVCTLNIRRRLFLAVPWRLRTVA